MTLQTSLHEMTIVELIETSNTIMDSAAMELCVFKLSGTYTIIPRIMLYLSWMLVVADASNDFKYGRYTQNFLTGMMTFGLLPAVQSIQLLHNWSKGWIPGSGPGYFWNLDLVDVRLGHRNTLLRSPHRHQASRIGHVSPRSCGFCRGQGFRLLSGPFPPLPSTTQEVPGLLRHDDGLGTPSRR